MASVDRRAAGMVMIRADADEWTNHAYREQLYHLVDRGVGGVGVFLGGLEETAQMIEDLQRRAGRRLIIAADYEHGLPMRLRGGIAFPRAMALGRTLAGITEHVAGCIALEARALGVHWNWAPVADINSNPQNPIINTRSFGELATTVSEHASAYVRGTQAQGVMACAKHAPGHGDTVVDSHVALPTIEGTRAIAEEREFAPFKACIAAGVRSVMVGHIIVPFLDAYHPASLSRSVVTDLIRREWGFSGLIVTDALDMHAITDRCSSAEAAVASVMAGVDVVLMPEDPAEAIMALATAIESGVIHAETVAAIEGRWEEARAFVGLRTAQGSTYSSRQPTVVDQSTHAMIALKSADLAISTSGNTELLPITNFSHLAVFAAIDQAEADAATTWFSQLAQATEMNIDFGFIDAQATNADVEELCAGVSEADCIVVAFFGKASAFRGSLNSVERMPEIVTKLASGRPTIVVSCGSPYGMEDIPADLRVMAYSDTLPSLAASVMRLIGRVVSEN